MKYEGTKRSNERTTDRPTEPKTKRVDETPVPRPRRPIIQYGGRNHPDLKIQSWAVTQVLINHWKMLNRRPYVAERVLYRFDVELSGARESFVGN